MHCLELRGQGHVRLGEPGRLPWVGRNPRESPGEGTEETAGTVEKGRMGVEDLESWGLGSLGAVRV